MATIFVSPGVYTKEQDFTVFASRVGITRLGLVGTTMKGPAFEPIKVSSTDEFLLRFGGTNVDYPLPYVANAFLNQSNELSVVRVLGKEGFTNSPAWMVIADKSTTYSGSTTESGMTLSISNQSTSTGWTFTTSANTSMSIGTISASTTGNDVFVDFSGSTLTTQDWYDAILATSFSGFGITLSGASSSTLINDTGSVESFTVSADTLESKGINSGSTLAILRSKRNQVSGNFYFTEEDHVKIGAISSTLGSFVLSASTGPLTGETNSGFTVSLDETREDYILKVFGTSPDIVDGRPHIYVESIYPHFVREASSRGHITGLHQSIIFGEDAAFTDYTDTYTNSVTPWIVSRVIGGQVRNLFKFQTISDGDSSAREVKVSIENIDINNYTFDVVVRRFEDTDSTASQTALERWSKLTLDKTQPNYIAKRIGTTDKTFPQKSMFITVDMAENIPTNTVPAGFRGYTLREVNVSGETAPDLYYKTTYLSGDSTFKTYLGISELGYTSFTQSQVSYRNSIKTLESDLFKYYGATSSGTTTIKGFHMENTADSTYFVTGDKNSLTGYTNTAGTAIDRTKLKFTVVPAGGFDGWDKYRTYTYPYERFEAARTSNVNAFKDAINELSEPEVVDINVLATPGIDFSNNESIVKHALDKVESRTDTLYIMDAPRISVGSTKGTPDEVVSILESTGIDSNYAATYWPWVQIEDTYTGEYTYQAPTLMVVQALAYTDNVAAPWFAPAGLNRGVASDQIIRADIRLNKIDRDTLYNARVNPIAEFVQQGVVIFGQKTLQVSESALDRINVRRLLLQVRRLISAASLGLLFEQNDQTLRDQFLSKVEPILLRIQNQRGLTAFKVVMDETNNTDETIDRNTLVGKIQIKPTRAAEFIDLTFQLVPTGANFDDF